MIDGSVTYTYGHSWRAGRPRRRSGAPSDLAFDEADFHDLAARVETFIDGTDTRVVAFCRLNALADRVDAASGSRPTSTNTRFDVQLSQGLPFLGALTRGGLGGAAGRAQPLLRGVRKAGVLDELAVSNPPKRVLGGISVRF